MSYTTVIAAVAGTTATASFVNTYFGDNITALRTGGIAIASQAAGDVIYASGASQFARLALGTENTPLTAGATAPEYSNGLVPVQILSDAPATPAADTLYADTIIKAWARVTYTTGVPAIDGDVNVASITDDGVGIITFAFATAMGSVNYGATLSPGSSGGVPYQGAVQTWATGSCVVRLANSGGTLADPADGQPISIIVVGAN